MSFQTLPLPPALHRFLSSFTWPAPPPYSPAPHQPSPLSLYTRPFPSVLCQIVYVYVYAFSRRFYPKRLTDKDCLVCFPLAIQRSVYSILILPVCVLTCFFGLRTFPLPAPTGFVCDAIDLPFRITDLPFACSHWICLPRNYYLVWPLLVIKPLFFHLTCSLCRAIGFLPAVLWFLTKSFLTNLGNAAIISSCGQQHWLKWLGSLKWVTWVHKMNWVYHHYLLLRKEL